MYGLVRLTTGKLYSEKQQRAAERFRSLSLNKIEIIDPIERSIQHELTKSLWQKLCEMRIKIGDKGRTNGIFISKSYEQAKALKASFMIGM